MTTTSAPWQPSRHPQTDQPKQRSVHGPRAVAVHLQRPGLYAAQIARSGPTHGHPYPRLKKCTLRSAACNLSATAAQSAFSRHRPPNSRYKSPDKPLCSSHQCDDNLCTGTKINRKVRVYRKRATSFARMRALSWDQSPSITRAKAS